MTRPKGPEGWGKILITVMLIYRHWVIIALSEKLSDISFGEILSLLHKKANIAFELAKSKKGHNSVKLSQLSQKFADDLQIQTWPVFYALPFCKI